MNIFQYINLYKDKFIYFFSLIDKKFFLFGFLTVLVLYGVYTIVLKTDDRIALNIQTVNVERGDISKTIKVLGQAELVDEQQLRFNQVGKITAVYFKDGETVLKGDIIAEMDKTDVENEIRQAEINLQNSQLSLQETLNGNTRSQLLQAQNSVNTIEQNIITSEKNLSLAYQEESNALKDLENEIKQAKQNIEERTLALENAQIDLNNTKIFEEEDLKTSNNTYDTTLDNTVLEMANDLIIADNIFSSLDAILGVEETTKENNDKFEQYLGFKKVNSKIEAVNSYKSAKVLQKNFLVEYEKIKGSAIVSLDDLIALLESSKVFFSALETAASDTYTMLQNTITISDELTVSDLNSYKSSVSNARSSSQNTIQSIESQIVTLKNLEALDVTQLRSADTIRQKEETLRSAQYALEKANDTLESLENNFEINKENKRLEVQSAENELENLRKDLLVKQEDLKEVQRGATAQSITMARNMVTQKQLALEKVKKDLENYELAAPFDGLLRKIDFKVGDNLVADDDKYVYIENPDLLKITILLDQIDVVQVEEGFMVNITFDAHPHDKFSGVISEIDQTPIEESGVVSYEASITLQKGNQKIFSGMTASLEVIIEEEKDVLLIPTLAIQTQGGKNYVQKIVDGVPQKTLIKTGITDGKNTQVVSGVSEGDQIVQVNFQSSNTSRTTNGASGSNDQMRSFMRATGGGAPRG